MKRTVVIAGIAVVILLLGLVAFVRWPGLAFAQAHGCGLMGRPGMHGMTHARMGAGGSHTMGTEGAGCPAAMAAALTPAQQEARAKTFAEHDLQHCLPGYTLEKKTTHE